MINDTVSTLAPETKPQEVPGPSIAITPPAQLSTEKQAIFDSISNEGFDVEGHSQNSPLKSVFTGLLWFGYTVAIVLALMLVWSAANGLLKAIPR